MSRGTARRDPADARLLKTLGRTIVAMERRGLAFDPRKAALLVVDMQDYFLDPSSHARVTTPRRLLRNIAVLAEAFRSQGRPVILTRHCNTRADAGLLGTWWHEVLTERNPLSRLTAALDRIPGTHKVRKTQYDAFHRTPLERILRAKHVSQLVVTGVVTHLCVETTVRSAFVRGFLVFLPVDATASFARRHHLASLINLSHGFAVPLLTGDILSRLGGRPNGSR